MRLAREGGFGSLPVSDEMGGDGSSKEGKRSKRSYSEEEDKSKRKRRSEEEEERKSNKSDERDRKKDKKDGKRRSVKDKKSKDKHKKKRQKADHDLKSQIQELSADDYYSKNNEFATWLKEQKNIFFSDLSSEFARELFSSFVKAWNRGKLDSRYYEGIASGPRTAHNWKIKL